MSISRRADALLTSRAPKGVPSVGDAMSDRDPAVGTDKLLTVDTVEVIYDE